MANKANDMNQRAWAWKNGYDTGRSSQTIWSVMMGAPIGTIGHGSHPRDPSDFGRCVRLFEAVPEWRPRLAEMTAVSPEWARLVERWDEIQASYDKALTSKTGVAPDCYRLIKQCIDLTLAAAVEG